MIYRSNKNSNFTIVNNNFLRNENLSWKAKGLLAYLMSLPTDWKLSVEDLKNRSKDKREATRTAMIELVNNGYCWYRFAKDEKGQFIEPEYYVVDEPVFKELVTNLPLSENRISVKPTSENQTLLNTILSKYFNIQSTVKEPTLFPTAIKVKKEKSKGLRNNNITFEDSSVAEFAKFKDICTEDYFQDVNLEYYHVYIKRWAKAHNVRKHDWGEYMKNWIMQDIVNKKVRKIIPVIDDSKYLKNYE